MPQRVMCAMRPRRYLAQLVLFSIHLVACAGSDPTCELTTDWCDPTGTAKDHLFVDGLLGEDTAQCGSAEQPCKSITIGIERANPSSAVCVCAGTYTYWENHQLKDPQILVNKSLYVMAQDGAVVDCSGNVSAMDILVKNESEILVKGLTFQNCSGVDQVGKYHTLRDGSTHLEYHAKRPWGIGGVPGGNHGWCANNEHAWGSGCSCAIRYCSRSGGVSIIHQRYQELDLWSSTPEALAPLQGVHVRFEDCTFRNNSAHLGGAVQLLLFVNYTDSSFTFIGCRFEGNRVHVASNASTFTTYGHGSAFYQQLEVAYNDEEKSQAMDPILPSFGTLLTNTSIHFHTCSFCGNLNPFNDGTMSFSNTPGYWDGYLIEVRDTNITHNIVGGNGGGIDIQGGIYLDSKEARNNTIRLTNVDLSYNKGTGLGTGGAFLGTFAYSQPKVQQTKLPSNFYRSFDYKTIVEMTDTNFTNNEGHTGGACAVGNGYHIMRRVQFRDNHARQQNGAIADSLVGGDSGMEFHDCSFENNTAQKFGQTMTRNGAGVHILNRTTFLIVGSQTQLVDVDLRGLGVSNVSADSKFVCPPGYVLQNPTGLNTSSGGFMRSTSGILDARWNAEGVGVSANYFQLSCFKCPAGRYKLNSASLQGPFWAAVKGPGADPDMWYGSIIGQATQSIQKECQACPSSGSCDTGGNKLRVAGKQLFGYACPRNRTDMALHNLSCNAPPVGLETDWEVHFSLCGKGFCKEDALSWDETCLPNRHGNLCGDCNEGYSETWFGSFPCVKNEHCNSMWWLLPLMFAALCAYGCYIYVSSQAGLYKATDAALLVFQMFPLVTEVTLSNSFRDYIMAPIAGIIGLSIIAGGGEREDAFVQMACMHPGLDAHRKIFLGLSLPATLVFIIIATHVLHVCFGLFSSWIRVDPEEQKPINPLFLAMLKTYLFSIEAVCAVCFNAARCVQLEDNTWYLFYAGTVVCKNSIFWKIVGAMVMCSPGLLCTLGVLTRRSEMMNGRFLSSIKYFVDAVVDREIENGMKSYAWWWPFGLAAVRSALTLLCSLSDLAVRQLLCVVSCAALVFASTLLRPFRDQWKNIHQGFLFGLLTVMSVCALGDAVLVQTGIMAENKLAGRLQLMSEVESAFLFVCLIAAASALAFSGIKKLSSPRHFSSEASLQDLTVSLDLRQEPRSLP